MVRTNVAMSGRLRLLMMIVRVSLCYGAEAGHYHHSGYQRLYMTFLDMVATMMELNNSPIEGSLACSRRRLRIAKQCLLRHGYPTVTEWILTRHWGFVGNFAQRPQEFPEHQ